MNAVTSIPAVETSHHPGSVASSVGRAGKRHRRERELQVSEVVPEGQRKYFAKAYLAVFGNRGHGRGHRAIRQVVTLLGSMARTAVRFPLALPRTDWMKARFDGGLFCLRRIAVPKVPKRYRLGPIPPGRDTNCCPFPPSWNSKCILFARSMLQ
jgi:hypothetical protein